MSSPSDEPAEEQLRAAALVAGEEDTSGEEEPELQLELTAVPAAGSEHETGVPGVTAAICANCEEDIWSGPEWDWEHFDSDEALCRLPTEGVQG